MSIIKYAAQWTNRSGTITAGGTAQVLAVANLNRKGLWIQNVSDTDMWISELGTAAANQPSIKIPAGAMYEFPVAVATDISIFCATTGKAFSAREW